MTLAPGGVGDREHLRNGVARAGRSLKPGEHCLPRVEAKPYLQYSLGDGGPLDGWTSIVSELLPGAEPILNRAAPAVMFELDSFDGIPGELQVVQALSGRPDAPLTECDRHVRVAEEHQQPFDVAIRCGRRSAPVRGGRRAPQGEHSALPEGEQRANCRGRTVGISDARTNCD